MDMNEYMRWAKQENTGHGQRRVNRDAEERDEMGVRNDEVEVRALRVGDEFRAGTMWLKITKVDAWVGDTRRPVKLETVDQWGDPVTYVLPAGMTVVRQ